MSPLVTYWRQVRTGDRVPSYHLSAQVVQRSKGRNTVVMAAYRAGQKLMDRTHGIAADYSRKRGVVHAEIMAPEGSATWLRDRETLWNHVEAMEKRKDAQLAREINFALPAEISAEERMALVRGFVAEQFVARGMVADIAIHAPVVERGDDPRNFHCHALLTLRQGTAEGLRAVKTREWNSDTLLQEWRAAWAAHQNQVLERAGRPERVDHRTLAAQRAEAQARGDRQAVAHLDRLPEIHEGPRARKRADRLPARSQVVTRSTARARGGVWYSSRTPEKRQREIDYRRIDRGSRATHARSRIEARHLLTRQRQERAERQAARLRDRLIRLERQARARPLSNSRQRVAWAQWLTKELTRLLAGLTARRQADRQRLQELVRAHDIRRALGLGQRRGRERRRASDRSAPRSGIPSNI